MKVTPQTNPYFSTVVREGMFSNNSRLQVHLDFIFQDMDFNGKNVLDIGGGAGLHSFYAAYMGAKKVVCLEPEGDGSSTGITAKFARLKEQMDFKNVELRPTRFQDLDPETEKFDIILLHSSVNHLDEPACINLLKDVHSQEVYYQLFKKIYSLSNKGAKLIVCDCSRYNFFGLFNLKNPMATKIEWHKHQSPATWAKILVKAGFTNPKIRWASLNRLGKIGRMLTGNKLAAYFMKSYFCLTMEKK